MRCSAGSLTAALSQARNHLLLLAECFLKSPVCVFASVFPQNVRLLTLRCGRDKVQYLHCMSEQTDHQRSDLSCFRPKRRDGDDEDYDDTLLAEGHVLVALVCVHCCEQ